MTDTWLCEHVAFVVDYENRDVRCSGCKAVLDPFAVLKSLETLAGQLERRIAALDAREAEQRRRQEWAIAQKRKKQLHAARQHCELCGGTGWAPGQSGVVRCRCRRA